MIVRKAFVSVVRSMEIANLLPDFQPVGLPQRDAPNDKQVKLIEKLKERGAVKSERVAEVMTFVDRGHFANKGDASYEDRPQPVACNTTISAPHMHGYALELLKDHLKSGSKALDVGSGSGYLTVCMALMVGPSGKVVGIEHMQELIDGSIANIRKDPELAAMLLDDKSKQQLKFVCGDGRLGYSADANYDAIHVGAAVTSVPEALTEQLAPGGRLIIPVGADGEAQQLVQIDKDMDGNLKTENLLGVRYVPLTSKDKQCPGK